MSVKVLGVRIDTYSKPEVLNRIRGFLHESSQNVIFTPNPEMLVLAHKNQQFRDILNSSSLNVCDGKGIQLVAKEKIDRYPGVDLMQEICRIAAEEGRSVYLLGSGDQQTAQKATDNLVKKFPKLRIVGYHPGPKLAMGQWGNGAMDEANLAINNKVIEEIQRTKPDIVFVAFGQGKQEWWIHSFLSQIPSVRLAMGVGGAFDFISGKVRRAPRLLRQLGLEWLWRLVLQPWRISRIAQATICFFLYAIWKSAKDYLK